MREQEPGLWVYSDTGQPVSSCPDRPCGYCQLANRSDGHDACLGRLRGGVVGACCGHGEVQSAYVLFPRRIRLGGRIARLAQWVLRIR